jgi:hypothetical protein
MTLSAITATQVGHVLLGAIGMLALGRARRLSWRWATVAATAYVFFGGYFGEAEHADIFRGFAYLPWLFWCLTPPEPNRRWRRLAALPVLGWLIASGAYPAQLVSFTILGATYLVVDLYVSGRAVWRRWRGPLVLAVASAGAACLVILLPFLRAEHAHELYRAALPTATVRAGESISPLDFLGLYLNNFAWTYDGTVRAWGIGIPILIGLACVRRAAVARHAALVASGGVALALAMTPKITVVGKAMVAAGSLFPSRFPAADYKAGVAITLIILGAEGWHSIATRRTGRAWAVIVAGAVLAGAALLAPTTYGPVTRTPWLLALVIVSAAALALLRPPVRILLPALILLIAIDGARLARDYRLLGRLSSWQVTPAQAAPYRARDSYVRELPTLLHRTPVARPARIPPAAPLSSSATGTDSDSVGWVADGYRLIDYGGTIERVLWQAEHSVAWTRLLLAPWHGFVFSCAAVTCDTGAVRLPSPSGWRPAGGVATLAYGATRITYRVTLSQPSLMVENELAIPGWRANLAQVHIVRAGIPLRAWYLPAGKYQFTATYHEPGRGAQEIALVAALVLWLTCIVWLRRTPVGEGPSPKPSPAT